MLSSNARHSIFNSGELRNEGCFQCLLLNISCRLNDKWLVCWAYKDKTLLKAHMWKCTNTPETWWTPSHVLIKVTAESTRHNVVQHVVRTPWTSLGFTFLPAQQHFMQRNLSGLTVQNTLEVSVALLTSMVLCIYCVYTVCTYCCMYCVQL